MERTRFTRDKNESLQLILLSEFTLLFVGVHKESTILAQYKDSNYYIVKTMFSVLVLAL